MPSFQYTAVDRQGTDTRGTVVAAHRQAAIDQLAGRGMFVTELLLSGEGEGGGSSNGRPAPEDRPNRTAAPSGLRVNLRSRVAIWRQLATSLEAGLPLLTALKVVEEQAEKPAVRELVGDLAKRVQRGDSLAEAMEAHPAAFGRMQLSMIRAGETAGVLDEVTASLAQFAERDLKVRERIRSASTYPVLVLGLAAVSVVLILTVVLPAILEGVTEAGGQIPLPTRILMGVSDLLLYWGWLLALIGVGAFFWFRRWVDTPEGRLAVDRLKLKIPVLGTTLRKVAVARFARALGTLTGAGIQILEALSVLRDSLGNEALAQEVDKVREAVTRGEPLAEPLAESGEFPPLFLQVVALGERTGKLDELLLQAADSLDEDTAAAIQRTMTVLPAVFIVLLAVLVGFILLSVLLPIVNLQSAVGM